MIRFFLINFSLFLYNFVNVCNQDNKHKAITGDEKVRETTRTGEIKSDLLLLKNGANMLNKSGS